MKELPHGWKQDKLKELVVDITSGYACGKHTKTGPGIIHFRPYNISSDGSTLFNEIKLVDPTYSSKRLEYGDVIFNNTNSAELVGKTCYYDKTEKIGFSNHMTRIKVNEGLIYFKYLALYLHFLFIKGHYREILNRHVNQASVNIDRLMLIDITYPKVNVQINIVQEIEKQISRLDDAVKSLKATKEKLQMYRKSLLKAAFNLECKKEPLGSLLKTTSGGTPPRSIKSYYSGSIPWLKSGELRDNMQIVDSEEHITQEAVSNSSAKLFPPNTVLIAMYGATTGKVGILRNNSTTNQAICAILPHRDVLSEFIYYYLLFKRQLLINKGKGGAQPNISQTVIKSLEFPKTSLENQKLVLQEIESNFSLVNKLEETIDGSLEKTENLRKSILKSAFEGKLVKFEAG